MSTKRFGNNITVNDNGTLTVSNLVVANSAYNTGHLSLGTYHFWVDATGQLRIKSGVPISDTDGSLVFSTVGSGSSVARELVLFGDGTTDALATTSSMSVGTGGALQTISVGNGSIAPGTRGTGAVDLQTTRTDSTQVASGNYSTISGGRDNKAVAIYSTIIGGHNCSVSSAASSSIIGGYNSSVTSTYSVIFGNSCQGVASNVVMGNTCTGLNSNDVAFGSNNSVSGNHQAALGGDSNSVGSANYSASLGGYGCVTATSSSACTLGGSYARASGQGTVVFSNGRFSAVGDAQSTSVVSRVTTTNSATPTSINLGTGSLVIPAGSTRSYIVRILARGIAGTNDNKVGFFEARFCVSYNTSSAVIHSGSIIETITNEVPSWSISLSTSGSVLNINAIGDTTSTVQWVARIQNVANLG